MRNEVKKFKSVKIIAIFVAIALFAAIPSGCIFNRKTLKYDSAKGAIASNKVENAQYTPDIDKYFGALNDAGTAACASLTADSEQTNSDEFTALIDKYAKIENYAGAGKYHGSSTDYYYRLTSDITLTSSEIAVDENGTYDIVCVLTTRENGKDKVMVDTMETSRLKDYYGLSVPDSSDNSGITRKYAVSRTGGELVITVSSDEE